MTRLIDKSYIDFLTELKKQISDSRFRATRVVNRELINLYCGIGKSLLERQTKDNWGNKILEEVSSDLSSAFPEMKGFSVRNLKYMRAFASTWGSDQIGQQAVAQLPWGHNIILLTDLANNSDRLWYARKSLENNWPRTTLVLQIESSLKDRLENGQKTHNFKETLPKSLSDLAQEALKDPYFFDFLAIGQEAHEREIEKALIDHIQKFLLELGSGFAYMGRQVPLSVGDQDFYLDLLFDHTKLHCYVVIELKTTDFKPEYVGKLNFYLTAVDELIKSSEDKSTIGILLCKSKNKVIAEYSLKDLSKPMGIAEFKLGDSIPEKIKTVLPTIEELEDELSSK